MFISDLVFIYFQLVILVLQIKCISVEIFNFHLVLFIPFFQYLYFILFQLYFN